MKRAWIITAVAAAAFALPVFGQVRGAPASVTSFGAGRGPTPGSPASVTSLGPRGFSSPCSGPLISSAMGCTPTQFTSGFFFPDARDRGPVNLRPKRHHGSEWGNSFWPVYVPYPVAVGDEPDPQGEVEIEPPAPTIFEHRATSERRPFSGGTNALRYGSHYLDTRESQTSAADPNVDQESAMPATTPAREQVPVVLVYRDGHRQEVSNYAIVGQTLYDLGTFMARKIPIADLNLKATIKANDDRGVEFNVPSSVKVE